MINNKELLLKRLRYRSGHRGCKETDLLFGKFCDSMLLTLDHPMLSAYERLLDENDADIWNWLTAKSAPPVAEYAALIDMLKGCGLP